ncbi:MAG: AraC family transcriptional regulator, partial [Pseudomonadota bacterium]
EANELSDGLAGMLRAIITGERELLGVCEACEQARKRAMQDFIAENLQNPDLGTALLCTTFNASRATVYRAFADLGGVAHYITAKRLQRAYWDLATGQYARGRISAVARAYGFFDAGNFNRAFRREFGMPPKDVIGARTKTAAARPSGDLLDRNIGQISRLDDLLSR